MKVNLTPSPSPYMERGAKKKGITPLSIYGEGLGVRLKNFFPLCAASGMIIPAFASVA